MKTKEEKGCEKNGEKSDIQIKHIGTTLEYSEDKKIEERERLIHTYIHPVHSYK